MKLTTILTIALSFGAASSHAQTAPQVLQITVNPNASSVSVTGSVAHPTTTIRSIITAVNGKAANGQFINSTTGSNETWTFDLWSPSATVGTLVATGIEGSNGFAGYGTGAYTGMQVHADLVSGALPTTKVRTTPVVFRVALTLSLSGGGPQNPALLLNHRGGLPVSASIPAQSGEVITLHTKHVIAPHALTVEIGALPATVLSAERLPDSSSDYEFKVLVPSGLYPGEADLQITDAYLPRPVHKIWVDGREQQ